MASVEERLGGLVSVETVKAMFGERGDHFSLLLFLVFQIPFINTVYLYHREKPIELKGAQVRCVTHDKCKRRIPVSARKMPVFERHFPLGGGVNLHLFWKKLQGRRRNSGSQ